MPPLGIVSPHMDDAVLSCGELLAAAPASHVVTIFSGGPHRVRRLPQWDELSAHFKPGDDVMGLRREEDKAAMESLGAQAHHLDFWDVQYRVGPRVFRPRRAHAALRSARLHLGAQFLLPRIEDRLVALVRSTNVSTWLVPLGLWHMDHRLANQAGLRVARKVPEKNWLIYEELPYARELPDEVSAALKRLVGEGWGVQVVDMGPGGGSERKRAAVHCYQSQLKPLGRRTELAIDGPERFYRLAPARGTAPAARAPSALGTMPSPRGQK
ncbi:MAG TPA: PIG-L family deacetylase [Acidimicrobiales bacterium]|nr:PIG-L family deacetylase [Acidimicrobiales bacterium]